MDYSSDVSDSLPCSDSATASGSSSGPADSVEAISALKTVNPSARRYSSTPLELSLIARGSLPFVQRRMVSGCFPTNLQNWEREYHLYPSNSAVWIAISSIFKLFIFKSKYNTINPKCAAIVQLF